MSNFVDLKIPQAWKPLFKAIDDQGWELRQQLDATPDWDCRYVLEFERMAQRCYLFIWEEGEWCGNNFQRNALTVAGFSLGLPADRQAVEATSFLLTGNWEEEVADFVKGFFQQMPSKNGDSPLISNEVQW